MFLTVFYQELDIYHLTNKTHKWHVSLYIYQSAKSVALILMKWHMQKENTEYLL